MVTRYIVVTNCIVTMWLHSGYNLRAYIDIVLVVTRYIVTVDTICIVIVVT